MGALACLLPRAGSIPQTQHNAAGNQRNRVGIATTAAQQLFMEHCERKADHARALWTLLVLCEWLDWVAEETGASGGRVAAGTTSLAAEPDRPNVAHA